MAEKRGKIKWGSIQETDTGGAVERVDTANTTDTVPHDATRDGLFFVQRGDTREGGESREPVREENTPHGEPQSDTPASNNTEHTDTTPPRREEETRIDTTNTANTGRGGSTRRYKDTKTRDGKLMEGGRYRKNDGTLLEKHTFYMRQETYHKLSVESAVAMESASETIERIITEYMKTKSKIRKWLDETE